MYVGRQLTELSDLPINQWKLEELAYYHTIISQLSPYINQEGISFHHRVVTEIERRGGLHFSDSSWDHGSQITFD
ncbi:hypothetical protein [Mechercharimyces sp. CAU 1602]|uniref:hypothetical protein n=1 Tax=Mechercharimyces sp. CAU 1602 TaxID=2973933 RepID=UPI002163A3B1|nr:hypothetical protein [Mechercharimyces sp. CAU 1602]MCS1352031.1 hypothetical protein [Mechercharimyces sp. CAU 1602]